MRRGGCVLGTGAEMISWFWVLGIIYVSVWLTLLGAKAKIDGRVSALEAADLALWPIGVPYRLLRSLGKGGRP